MAKLKKVSIRNTTQAPRMFYGSETNKELIRVLPGETVETLLRAQLVEDVKKAREKDGDDKEVEITVLGDGPEELPLEVHEEAAAADEADAEVTKAGQQPAARRAHPPKSG
jgi:hypothetical protein